MTPTVTRLEGVEEEDELLPRFVRTAAELTLREALSAARAPEAVAADLLDALVGLLGLDLAYARVDDAEIARGAPAGGGEQAEAIRAAVAPLLSGPLPGPTTIRDPLGPGELRVHVTQLGDEGQRAWLAAASSRGGFPTSGERRVLEVAASLGATALRLGRAVADARRTEASLEQVLASVSDGVLSIDREWRITYLNDRVLRATGKRRDQVIGQRLVDVFPWVQIAPYRRALDEGVTLESALFYPKGRRWFGVRAYPSEGGLTVRVRDQIQELDRSLMASLIDLVHATAALDLPEIIEQVGQAFRRHLRWDRTALWLFDREGRGLRLHVVSKPEGRGPRVPDGTLIPLEGTLSGRALREGGPIVAGTLSELETYTSDVTRRLHEAGYRSACAAPLVCRGKSLGTIVASALEEHAFDAEALEILVRVADLIAPAIVNALALGEIRALKERLARENVYLAGEIEADFGEIVGRSAALKRVLSQVEVVAPTDAAVLVTGETGTGKELVARAIHRLSGRSDRAFVKVNCAAIPAGLLESELFGHERGAFTGAIAQRVGRFELASGGTLFLDEIGELPRELQPKLLQVLQDREVQRVGGARPIGVDLRLVAATNADLAEMVEDGTFRSDLYYRVNVFPIEVPALRERPEDISLLARHFIERHARRYGKTVAEIPAETLEALERYPWPGNVRELKNVLERSVILTRGPVLQVPLGALRPATAREAGTLVERTTPDVAPPTLAGVEQNAILRALEATGWVVGGKRGAAARLGLSRTTLQARMRKLGISRPG